VEARGAASAGLAQPNQSQGRHLPPRLCGSRGYEQFPLHGRAVSALFSTLGAVRARKAVTRTASAPEAEEITFPARLGVPGRRPA
jgi:hypothetical protein